MLLSPGHSWVPSLGGHFGPLPCIAFEAVIDFTIFYRAIASCIISGPCLFPVAKTYEHEDTIYRHSCHGLLPCHESGNAHCTGGKNDEAAVNKAIQAAPPEKDREWFPPNSDLKINKNLRVNTFTQTSVFLERVRSIRDHP